MPNDNGLISVNEVYFGKTKELLQIEKLIGVIRDKYGDPKWDGKASTFVNSMIYKGDRYKVNACKELISINKLFEQAFGFGLFSLIIIHTDMVNAFTAPVCMCLDAPEETHKLVASTTGFKKSGGDKTFVCVFDGIFFNPKMTNAEVLGIILHEVGHNFQTAISPICRGASYISRLYNIINIPIDIGKIISQDPRQVPGYLMVTGMLSTNVIRSKWIKMYKDAMSKSPAAVETAHATNLLVNAAMKPLAIFRSFKNIINVLTGKTLIYFFDILKGNVQRMLLSTLDERGEIIADKFATVYGYGAECQSAMVKAREIGFGDPATMILQKIPIISTYLDLMNVPMKVLQNIIDCHPADVFRAKDTLDYLERELAKENVDPRLKKEIQNQIKMSKENVKKYTDILDTKFMFTNAYAALMLTVFNGDPKALIFGIGSNEDFDRAFEKNLEMVNRREQEKKRGK